jgi:hypothetical protein
MNWDLGHGLLLLALWLIPVAFICAGLIAIILVSWKVGLASGCQTIGAWFWATGYGIYAFKAEQKLYFTKCMEMANDPSVSLSMTREATR